MTTELLVNVELPKVGVLEVHVNVHVICTQRFADVTDGCGGEVRDGLVRHKPRWLWPVSDGVKGNFLE
jgi:hypothetical protein